MGFIDKLFGRKKDKEELKARGSKEATIEESAKIEEQIGENETKENKNEDVKVVNEKDLLLNILKDKISKMNLEVGDDGDKVVLPELDTTIKASIKNKIQQGDNSVVEIDFLIENKDFGEDEISESLAGIGKNNDLEEAISSSVDIFIKSVLNVVVEALKGNHNPLLDIETSKRGITRIWHSYIGNLQGSENLAGLGNNHYFNLLREPIVRRLNNLKYYWIKVLITRQVNGAVLYQCNLNNRPFLEAERILDEYVKQLPSGRGNSVEMQYIIIRQSDESYNENRQKDIEYENFLKECAEYAISVFEDYGPEDTVEGLVNKIAEFAKDFNIAWELFWFIPAIYCRVVMQGVSYADTVILVLPDERRFFGKLYDYETYLAAVDVVLKKLQENQSKSKIEKILFLSEEFKALQKMLKEGSDPKDLRPVPMVLMAPLSYNVID